MQGTGVVIADPSRSRLVSEGWPREVASDTLEGDRFQFSLQTRPGNRSMEPTYYRINVSNVTYAECWRGTRNLFEFALICILKTFRLSSLVTYAITNEGFRRLPWGDLHVDVRASLQSIRGEFEAMGFRYGFCYGYPTLGTMQAVEMVLLSSDGNMCVSIKHERHQSGTSVTSVATSTIVSELSNGTFLVTCDRQDVLPPEFVSERHPRYSPTQLVPRHRERVDEGSTASPIPLREDYDVERRVRDIDQRIFRYQLERGILVPLSVAEVDRYKTPGDSPNSTATALGAGEVPAAISPRDTDVVDLSDEDVLVASLADDPTDDPTDVTASRYPGVIAELEKIRNKKGSWLSGALILGFSIVFFLGAGAARWNWHFALLLIPILLFHELGHFVAMRSFKYRNLKMFFIPLLGAAVTGQNYNVAGWKKAIVSLAGPVPGIVAGILLGLLAMYLGDQPLLLEAAKLTVFLNGFNLLPFLPLDGGWIVHILLFSRHPVLDTTFRFLAAVVLISSGLLGIWILAFLGVMMLIGLRAAHRVARVAADVRDSSIDTSSPDGQSIPIETADAIISRLDAASPLPVPDAIKAQQTLQVFESVNARPPGLLGTLALGGVHGASLVIAMIFFVVFSFVQQGDREDLKEAAATAPRNASERGVASTSIAVRLHKPFDSRGFVSHDAREQVISRSRLGRRITLDSNSQQRGNAQ